jgi:hypothetical protein
VIKRFYRSCSTNQPSSTTICLSPSRSRSNSNDRATALILAPHWPGQPWFPQLWEMLVDYPRLLPQRPHLISLPFEPGEEHLLQHMLHLTVWPVSASAIAQRYFQQRLQEFSCPHEVRLPRNDILDRGALGQAGVVNSRSVPLLPVQTLLCHFWLNCRKKRNYLTGLSGCTGQQYLRPTAQSMPSP